MEHQTKASWLNCVIQVGFDKASHYRFTQNLNFDYCKASWTLFGYLLAKW